MYKKGKYVLVIGAVFIIVFATFNTVVGNKSESNEKRSDSPLFFIRTKRSNDVKFEKPLITRFIGKEKMNLIPFNSLNIRHRSLTEAISAISMMSEEHFDQFLRLAVNELKYKESLNNDNIVAIEKALILIRENPNEGIKSLHLLDEKTYPTISTPCVGTVGYGCIIGSIILILLSPILIPFVLLVETFWRLITVSYYGPRCHTYGCDL